MRIIASVPIMYIPKQAIANRPRMLEPKSSTSGSGFAEPVGAVLSDNILIRYWADRADGTDLFALIDTDAAVMLAGSKQMLKCDSVHGQESLSLANSLERSELHLILLRQL